MAELSTEVYLSVFAKVLDMAGLSCNLSEASIPDWRCRCVHVPDFVLGWSCVGAALGAMLGLVAQRHLRTTVLAAPRTVFLCAMAAAALFGVLAGRYGLTLDAIPATVLALFGSALSVIDVAEQRIPKRLVSQCSATLVGVCVALAAATGEWPLALRALAAGVGLGGAYLLLALASRGGLGAGDVRLGIAVGVAAGWYGWSHLLAGTLMAWTAAALVQVLLKASCHDSLRSTAIPMAPFFILGQIVAIVTL
ncbi:A24 family peptidase [Kutzneria viridogrisea]|uniref:Leader peptidase (Prepilin peptidase)/N-methyltransferase n=1 Tax=Kutzneria viridogrisea TaxID=47990 RepID=A0ABR6BJ04_9PSEU|nr:leader peptidase (prepilin peptidase)/N-methyltransferase [Kutzneria viridogrisea]